MQCVFAACFRIGQQTFPLGPRQPYRGRVAQLAEHSTLNRQVEGSIPSASTIQSVVRIGTVSTFYSDWVRQLPGRTNYQRCPDIESAYSAPSALCGENQ